MFKPQLVLACLALGAISSCAPDVGAVRGEADLDNICFFRATITREGYENHFDTWVESAVSARNHYFEVYGLATFLFDERYYYLDSCEGGSHKEWVPSTIDEYVEFSIYDKNEFESLLRDEYR